MIMADSAVPPPLTPAQLEAIGYLRAAEGGMVTSGSRVTITTARALERKGYAVFTEGSTRRNWGIRRTGQSAPGNPVPPESNAGRPGFVVGECWHAVAGSEWRAGFRACERCWKPRKTR
jgi:hypothetical protein